MQKQNVMLTPLAQLSCWGTDGVSRLLRLICARRSMVLIGILAACVSQPGLAEQPLERIEFTIFATVGLADRSLGYGADETTARLYGCTFSSQNRELVVNLVKLLKDNVKVATFQQEDWMAETREVVFLMLSNRERIRLEFEPVFRGRKEVRGRLFRGKEAINISADLSMPKKLYEWSAKADANSPIGDMYIQSDKVCDYVNHYEETQDHPAAR
jgi:hypothetical protein